MGTGLAGLRSAMILESASHEVVLFEARDRPGGRLHTTPSGFETGAEWVDEDHDRMRGLMRQLSFAEAPAPPGDYLLSFQGARCLESRPWPEAAQDALRFESLATSATADDGATVAELVYASCLSDSGRWLVTANIRTDEGDEPENLSLAQWLEFRNKYAHRDGREASAFRIDGGGSKFIETMLSKLHAKPAFGSTLRAVREGSEVELTFESFSTKADAVILALPLPCLNEIDIDPPLASATELKKLGFAPALKARISYGSAFWKDEGWHGYLKADHLIQQTWPDREDPDALIAYICGDAARILHQSGDSKLLLSSDLHNISSEIAAVEVKDWTADPFARGAFSTSPPGSNPEAVRRRDGRKVQLAGEFCASWMGFMEGALESAENATRAILS